MRTVPGSPTARAVRWLAIALAAELALAAVLIVGLRVFGGEGVRLAATATVVTSPQLLADRTSVDSWRPMWGAYDQLEREPDSDLYRIFFVDQVKFQYPPSSLLAFDLFPRSLLIPTPTRELSPEFRGVITWLSRLAVLITILATLGILKLGLERLPSPAGDPRARRVQMIALALLGSGLALTFYPLLRAYQLGQIQVFLNALIAVGLLAYLAGREAFAGVCLGVCCLVKPQYVLVLVWGLLRQRKRFMYGAGAVLALGLALSVARFGFVNHLRYVQVLQAISRFGESFWPNQSMNGLLHRLLGNGAATEFSHNEFAPYHPLVHVLTVLSSVALLVLALWPGRGAQRARGGPIDLALLLLALTVASPVAWEHHYGGFIALFALALPYLLEHQPFGRATLPLFCASYLAVANVFLRPQLLFANPVTGLLGSHLFFGALLLCGVLVQLRSAEATAGAGELTTLEEEPFWPRLRPVLLRAGGGLAVTAVVFLIFEGGARLLFKAPPTVETDFDGGIFAGSRDLGWVLRPGFSGTFDAKHPRAIDSEGFYTVDTAQVADARTPKIAFIGDSNTYGFDVATEQTFVEIADRLLPGAHAINLGVPGYSSAQGVLVAERRLARLQPKLAVISFNFNDRRYTGRSDGPESFLLAYRRSNEYLPRRINRALESSRAFAALQRVDQRVRGLAVASSSFEAEIAPRVEPDQYAENLERIVATCRRLQIRPVFLLLRDSPAHSAPIRAAIESLERGEARSAIATLEDYVGRKKMWKELAYVYLAKAYRKAGDDAQAASLPPIRSPQDSVDGAGPVRMDREYNDAMRRVAAALRVDLIDGASVLESVTPDPFTDQCHFDALGHQRVGELLAARLSQLMP